MSSMASVQNLSGVCQLRNSVEFSSTSVKHSVVLKKTPFFSSPLKAAVLTSVSNNYDNVINKRSNMVISASTENKPSGRIISGPCFVVHDNIDTDQIIPAEYLTLVPSKPEEYEKLGSYAMVGLPEKYGKYIEDGQMKTKYPIMIGGANFGCGSSREHAPVAMGAAGCRAVVAESYARIYFRNCVATGELYPVESTSRLCEEIATGDEVTVDMEHDLLIHHPSGKQYSLKPIGEAGPVIDAGGIFNYARETGMIAAKA